jgi:lysyl endopeptidase
MNQSLKLLLTAYALCLLAACGNSTSSAGADSDATASKTTDSTVTAGAAATAQTLTVDARRPTSATLVTQESTAKVRDLDAAPTPTTITLGAPLDSQTANAQKSTAEDHMGKPLQIGFGREVVQTSTPAATQQVLKWQTTASGSQLAAINFSSTGAKGMRLGLLVNQLPDSSTLRFYAKGETTAFEITGAEVWKVLAANLSTGDKSDAGRTYWGPVAGSADATIEIELPRGIRTSAVNVSIPSISHLFMSSKDASTASQSTYSGDSNAGLTCQVDVTCTTPLPAASDAVAHLIFNNAGSSYICSGTLLNDSINSGTPYLLTANHCISSQTVASTLISWFQYRSITCNNAATGTYFQTSNTPSLGAKLLYTAYNTDSTLVQLNGTITSPTPLFAGWDATTPPATTTVIHNIHHPKGDQQRLSRGTVTGYYTRSTTNSNGFFGSNIGSSTILNVTLTTGLTEGGSSGSGLFKGADSNPQVIGQLYGGSAPTCGVNSSNVYGRFDVAFNAGMSDFLVKGIKSVTQFYNATSGMYFYTSSAAEISSIPTANPAYGNQGQSFKVSSYQTAGLSPVYRFYNTSNGSYFYTISEKERAAVTSNTPLMRYDGIVWYASATAAAGTVPLYSAFNTVTGSQYFTTSLATRSSLIAANPQFITDGIAFYVTP